MEQMLIRVLNMSLTGGITVLAVLLLRVVLRRAPKIFSYVLWLTVLFRLLCPVSFSLDFSLPGLVNAPVAEQGQIWYIPENIGLMGQPEVSLPAKFMTDMFNSSLPAATPEASMNPMQGLLFVGALLWLAGIVMMVLYSLAVYGRLMRKLRGAEKVEGEDRVYSADRVAVPFVCGLVRPRIYLPGGLAEEERACVLTHERIHIKRGDPIWRALGYLALCIHWFNPLVWVAFFASERDMEMSCDEAAVRALGDGGKKGYCTALLSLTCGRSNAPGFPPAFGEGQTGSRIRNLFHYKKAGGKVMAALAAVCAAAVVLLIANPAGERGQKYARQSCYDIPLGDGALSWGMSRQEVIEVLGEPAAEEKSDAGSTLTFDGHLDGELGGYSQVILYVGSHNLTDPGDASEEKLSSGLCGIMMTVEETTREEVLKKMNRFYGELSPEGGGTLMETQLREGQPDYFNEMHFCEDWRLGNLPRTDYDRLAEIFRASWPDRILNEEKLLLSVYLWGVANGDSYPCVVQLDGSMNGMLAYLPGPRL